MARTISTSILKYSSPSSVATQIGADSTSACLIATGPPSCDRSPASASVRLKTSHLPYTALTRLPAAMPAASPTGRSAARAQRRPAQPRRRHQHGPPDVEHRLVTQPFQPAKDRPRVVGEHVGQRRDAQHDDQRPGFARARRVGGDRGGHRNGSTPRPRTRNPIAAISRLLPRSRASPRIVQVLTPTSATIANNAVSVSAN